MLRGAQRLAAAVAVGARGGCSSNGVSSMARVAGTRSMLPLIQSRATSIQDEESPAHRGPSTSFRAHFIVTKPLWDLVNQPNKSPATLTLSEVLFDTEEHDLLKRNRWLWQRDVWDSRDNTTRSMWYLKQRTRCDLDGLVQFDLTESDSNEAFVGELTRPVVPVVALYTTRVQCSPSVWLDFTSWSRWKAGYYAVATVAGSSVDECYRVAESALGRAGCQPATSKILTCLQHCGSGILQNLSLSDVERELACHSAAFVADRPLHGICLPTLEEEIEKDSDSADDDE